jgi:hypothetical protein
MEIPEGFEQYYPTNYIWMLLAENDLWIEASGGCILEATHPGVCQHELP